jgi:RNA polymerase sigma factor (sigma-70 family)
VTRATQWFAPCAQSLGDAVCSALVTPEPNPRSDLDLRDAWATGDETAGNELVARHFSSVYRFFRTKVPESADDLAQATFLGCVEGRERFEGRSSFKTYLLGIARNQLLYHFRKRGRDELVEWGHQSVMDLAKSPSRIVADSEQQQVLISALQQIPLDYQTTLELYYWEGLTQREVAEILGIKEGTAKSRLSEGRALLRDQLAKMPVSADVRDSAMAIFDRPKVDT